MPTGCPPERGRSSSLRLTRPGFARTFLNSGCKCLMLGAGPAACGSQGEAGGLVLSVAREQGRCDAGLGTSAKHCYAPGVLAYLLRTLWGSLRADRGLWWGRSAAWLGRARAPAVERTQSPERSHRTPKVRPNVRPAVGGGLQCSARLICFLECTYIPEQS